MLFFFFKQKTAYEMLRSLVGSEMCIRDRAMLKEPGKLSEMLSQLAEMHVQAKVHRFDQIHTQLQVASHLSVQLVARLKHEEDELTARVAELEARAEKLGNRLGGSDPERRQWGMAAFSTSLGMEDESVMEFLAEEGFHPGQSDPQAQQLVPELMQMGHEHCQASRALEQTKRQLFDTQRADRRQHPRAGGMNSAGVQCFPCLLAGSLRESRAVSARHRSLRFVDIEINHFSLPKHVPDPVVLKKVLCSVLRTNLPERVLLKRWQVQALPLLGLVVPEPDGVGYCCSCGFGQQRPPQTRLELVRHWRERDHSELNRINSVPFSRGLRLVEEGVRESCCTGIVEEEHWQAFWDPDNPHSTATE
eukprot:TRINITY_DN21552_c0_g1_i1.p1 TRINITY_DN21552_c0_g1~~TRINITY_DN21552_c0_g1_i1.p1  ORF type:complete len:362 (-),score=99.06 TRINITY_DN21552_c0_g1_i1:91-1176(-)